MEIIELIKEITDHQISLTLDGDDLQISFDGDQLDPNIIAKLKEHKAELVAYFKKYSSVKKFEEIKKIEIQESYALSHSQERLWILSQIDNGSIAYNMPSSIELKGNYNVENFSKAILSVIKRHEILRTVFRKDSNEEIRQWVIPAEKFVFKVDYHDYRSIENKEENIRTYIEKDSFRPFDLINGPLLRATLLQTSDTEFTFYYNMHHIISDGWSMRVLSEDVLKYYSSAEAGINLELEELPFQYKDFAAWQTNKFVNTSKDTLIGHWKDLLSNDVPTINLPSNLTRPNIQTYNGQLVETIISKALTERLKQFSNQNKGSLFTTLLGIWNILIYRYTNLKDITIGTPTAGRDNADLENQIGLYVNTILFRNQINPEIDFDTHYEDFKSGTIETLRNQCPFDFLLEELKIKRDISRNAIFDILFAVQNQAKSDDKSDLENLVNKIDHKGKAMAKVDLEINFFEQGDYLSFQLIYNSDVYEKEMISKLMTHFILLSDALLESKTAIGKVNFLTVEEENFYSNLNIENAGFYSDKTVVDLFLDQVANHPSKIAVGYQSNSLSYSDLDKVSNQFANFLHQTYKLNPEQLLGIMLDRSEWLVVCILGVLKSGCAYLPFDLNSPPQRKAYIQENSNCETIIDQTVLEAFRKSIDNFDTTFNGKKPTSTDLAYVIYTSGSTGNPKGVMIEHRNVASFFDKIDTQLGYNKYNIVGATTNISFDISILELLGTLCLGKQLIVFDDKEILDVKLFMERVRLSEIEVLQLTPSRIKQLYSDLIENKPESLRCLIVGGEPFPAEYYQNFKENKELSVVNVYGPTETTIWSTYLNIGSSSRLNIGSPLANEKVYILNDYGAIQPIGIVGEIHIAGSGLARGYIGDLNLSNQKFIQNPLDKNEIIYKTGDLGSWKKDGTIDYFGRKDDQIKLRGYRIELSEIEYHIQQISKISQAVVLLKEIQGEKELVAYVTAEKNTTIKELRAILKNDLPQYMIPSKFIFIDSMPLQASGKIDKVLLKQRENYENASESIKVKPSNKMEEKIIEIWTKILGGAEISMNDDFFDLGGHSLKATKLISEYQKEFGKEISLIDLFTNTTAISHVNLINEGSAKKYAEIPLAEEAECYPLSDAQKSIWLMCQRPEGALSYHIPIALDFEIEDYSLIEEVVQKLMNRHHILKTVFKNDKNDEIKQWILNDLEVKVKYDDFRGVENAEEKAREIIFKKELFVHFDLENGPLFKVGVFQLEANKYLIYMIIHHIITDGLSMNIIFNDAFSIYQSLLNNSDESLPNLPIQYKDFSVWQQSENSKLELQKKYWSEKLSGELTLLELPSSKVRPGIKTYNGEYLNTYFDKVQTEKLRDFSKNMGGSVFISLMTVWNILIHRYNNKNDIVVGTALAGRDHLQFENMIGCFVNNLAIRNEICPTDTIIECYKKIQKSILNDFENQLYSFDKIVEDLDIKRNLSRSPVFDFILVHQRMNENQKDINLDSNEKNQIISLGDRYARYDVELGFFEMNERLMFRIKYNKDIYDRSMIDRLMLHFIKLTEVIGDNPKQKIKEVDFLLEEEKYKLINEFVSKDNRDKSKIVSVVDKFREQLILNPNKNALVYNDTKLSYSQLDEVSTQLSHFLIQKHGIESNDLVGIKLERNEWTIIAILGILKAGAAYVPIDIEYPKDRIAFIESDANCKVLIDQEELEDFKNNLDRYSKNYLEKQIDFESLAYVIYTSGSTGKPKGVMITHSNLAHSNNARFLTYGNLNSFLLTSPIAFDSSVAGIFGTLCSGGTLHLSNKNLLDSVVGITNYIVQNRISHLLSIPSYFKLVLEELADKANSLEGVIVAGETCPLSLIDLFHDTQTLEKCNLFNEYGPTECSVWSTVHQYDRNEKAFSTIGKPIIGSKIYIFDEEMRLSPNGHFGEMYIGGAGVAKGYHNQEILTAEKFVKNPLNTEEVLYKTGDIAKWLKNGELEFLGRKDDQVKINGYRIELEEIQKQLELHQDVNLAIVLIKEGNTADDNQIVAWVNSDIQINIDELKEFIAKKIPHYMIPAVISNIEKVPLTPNGKIDKAKLLGSLVITKETEIVKPTNQTEESLLDYWKKVLNREQISTKDNFLELGGNSIKAIKLLSEINKHFETNINLGDLFNNLTIQQLSVVVENSLKENELRLNKDNLMEIEL
uniref:non-ribosomal peptide synthetase n=1 Tax=Flavobacterium poyangense TaxID=2204302 RepID=UPI0014232582|nr:non-ribosomal peptide synthetase [Flavobacterium sp. JXAS1]